MIPLIFYLFAIHFLNAVSLEKIRHNFITGKYEQKNIHFLNCLHFSNNIILPKTNPGS